MEETTLFVIKLILETKLPFAETLNFVITANALLALRYWVKWYTQEPAKPEPIPEAAIAAPAAKARK